MKHFLCFLCCLILLCGCACAERLPDDQLVTYYDQAVYVGDSLGEMLRYYINGVVRKEHPTYFKGVKFFTAHGYKLETAALSAPSHSETNLMYKGAAVSVGKLMEKLKPGRVFILAGMNDRVGDDIPKGLANVEAIATMISQASPDTQIHFFSLTPIAAAVEKKAPGRQGKWDQYNAALETKCAELGVYFIDIATSLKDDKGLLAPALASEDGYHLSDAGNAVWVQRLLDFAQAQYESGNWTPAPQNP